MQVLAIDQGTTSTRGMLVDADGGATLLASREHRQIYPSAGWVEHDPKELLDNLRACIGAAEGRQPLAIGLSNQGESCLAWSAETGEPISPVIVWQDSRTAPETERMKAEGLEPEVLARSGLPLDAYFSASKLGWILREIPEAAALAARGALRLGTTDAYFRDRLTGRYETDIATASRTSLLNLETLAWDPELCRMFGVPIEALPAITDCTGDLGAVGATPLTASIVDQQAALFGHGCRAAGDVKITFGTGAFALALAGDTLPKAKGVLPTIAWREAGRPVVYALDGGVYTAASALNWARRLGLFEEFESLSAFPHPSAIARGLVFVPALAGLACPHWDREARGSWLGLSLDMGKEDLVQAVLEGVALRVEEALQAMSAATPLAETVTIDGGLSRNPWFQQFLADVLGRKVAVCDEPELTAIGLAMLAARGAGAEIAAVAMPAPIEPRPFDVTLKQLFGQARLLSQGFGELERRRRA